MRSAQDDKWESPLVAVTLIAEIMICARCALCGELSGNFGDFGNRGNSGNFFFTPPLSSASPANSRSAPD